MFKTYKFFIAPTVNDVIGWIISIMLFLLSLNGNKATEAGKSCTTEAGSTTIVVANDNDVTVIGNNNTVIVNK